MAGAKLCALDKCAIDPLNSESPAPVCTSREINDTGASWVIFAPALPPPQHKNPLANIVETLHRKASKNIAALSLSK